MWLQVVPKPRRRHILMKTSTKQCKFVYFRALSAFVRLEEWLLPLIHMQTLSTVVNVFRIIILFVLIRLSVRHFTVFYRHYYWGFWKREFLQVLWYVFIQVWISFVFSTLKKVVWIVTFSTEINIVICSLQYN